MCKRFENLGCSLAEATACYCCAFYALLSSSPPLPPLLLFVLDITSLLLLLLLLHWGLFEKVEIFCLHMYLIVLSRVQVLNSGGAPSLHHQCKATTETWGCRTPHRSMRHSSCLHPSAPPPAAATAVRHASPPRPRKHTVAPFKAPGGGGGGKLLCCLASSLFLWLPFFSAGVVNQTLRHRGFCEM